MGVPKAAVAARAVDGERVAAQQVAQDGPAHLVLQLVRLLPLEAAAPQQKFMQRLTGSANRQSTTPDAGPVLLMTTYHLVLVHLIGRSRDGSEARWYWTRARQRTRLRTLLGSTTETSGKK
mmetsp:Transcript_76634/g.135678  ORF Transcript_76634/g.135678 Transcript_76634/m.135678 type:complete len:121 (-) Transcript_76634:539-901(-)